MNFESMNVDPRIYSEYIRQVHIRRNVYAPVHMSKFVLSVEIDCDKLKPTEFFKRDKNIR